MLVILQVPRAGLRCGVTVSRGGRKAAVLKPRALEAEALALVTSACASISPGTVTAPASYGGVKIPLDPTGDMFAGF